jgi:hypothetical protein
MDGRKMIDCYLWNPTFSIVFPCDVVVQCSIAFDICSDEVVSKGECPGVVACLWVPCVNVLRKSIHHFASYDII